MIKVVERKMYKTSDGTEFEDRSNALTHEAVCLAEENIAAFLAGPCMESSTPRFKASVRKRLVEFVEHCALTGEVAELLCRRSTAKRVESPSETEYGSNDGT